MDVMDSNQFVISKIDLFEWSSKDFERSNELQFSLYERILFALMWIHILHFNVMISIAQSISVVCCLKDRFDFQSETLNDATKIAMIARRAHFILYLIALAALLYSKVSKMWTFVRSAQIKKKKSVYKFSVYVFGAVSEIVWWMCIGFLQFSDIKACKKKLVILPHFPSLK